MDLPNCEIFQLRNLVHPFTKLLLQRSWYWTGQVRDETDQWAEFEFELDAVDPLKVTMITRTVAWDRSMEVEPEETLVTTGLNALNLGLAPMNLGGDGE